MAFLNALPGAVAEGLIWGLMAIGIYISYKILDIADLSVDGSICTGGCVCAMLIGCGVPVWLSVLVAFLAGLLAGTVTGLLHTALGIPSILAGILTQLMLYTVNLCILGGKSLVVVTFAIKSLLVEAIVVKAVDVIAKPVITVSIEPITVIPLAIETKLVEPLVVISVQMVVESFCPLDQRNSSKCASCDL